MRFFTVALTGIVGFGVLLVCASSGASDANPLGALRAPARTSAKAVRSPYVRRRPGITATPCDLAPSHGFVGVPNNDNVALSYDSAVLGGYYNEACNKTTSIGGGIYNLIGDDGTEYYSFIGGGNSNTIGSIETFIGAGKLNAAGGSDSFAGAGLYNYAEGNSSFVGAGGQQYVATNHASVLSGNVAGATDSFVGAGDSNQIASTGNGSFIGAGGYEYALSGGYAVNNKISGDDSFIGAGDQNSILANDAAIVGGQKNVVNGNESVVAGGLANTTSSAYAAVGGGKYDSAVGTASVVGGGAYSSARGTYATIPGGYQNAADGIGSFAAGTGAKARNLGAFVWNDNSTSAALQSTASYQFLARASGGFYLYSNSAETLGVKLAPNSGTWGSLSDRTMKSNVVPLDDAAVLDKVAALPVSEWSYTAERGVRHVGPMAQDFYAAFGVGEDNRHITTIDEDGVALAAIKALHAENARLRGELESDNARFRSRLAVLEAKLDRLASRSVR